MSPSIPDTFVHPALFYRDTREYLAGILPFLRDGLAAGQPVAAALPEPNVELVREALGQDAAQVKIINMSEAGRNPGRIIPAVLRAFADGHADRPVRIVGEPIWPGRTPSEYPACAQHEALINLAFAGRAVSILCPYDASRLDTQALADAAVTHPRIIDSTGERASATYAPGRILTMYNVPLLPPEDRPHTTKLIFSAANLHQVRQYAAARGRRLGLAQPRVADVELAVSELATNSIRHGGGRGTLQVWRSGHELLCEVRDRGTIGDPLAGRRPVPPDKVTGRGLLLVHQLVDLVRVHTSSAGTTVRLHVALAKIIATAG